jgi:hypothetical protein
MRRTRFPDELYQQFGDQGFPSRIVDAFQEVANRMQCVIMTRTPGSVGTQLIDERYDLKGFGIHSKSCNWGPMAGFVCMTPHLNKAGYDKIDFNLTNTMDALNYIQSIDDKRKGTIISKDPEIIYEPTDPFPQLCISKDRFDWLRQRFNEPTKYGMHCLMAKDSSVVGVAHDTLPNGPTVAMEFVLSEDNDHLFRLWHGNIFLRADKDAQWKLLTPTQLPVALRPRLDSDVRVRVPELNRTILQKLWLDVPGVRITELPECTAFPVRGIRNAFPPYLEAVDRLNNTSLLHKNAVTGDYDLFAVWPLNPRYDQVRTVESKLRQDAFLQAYKLERDRSVFAPPPDKALSLASRACPSLIVEFIPKGDVMEQATGDGKLPPEQLGNTNDLVSEVGQMLNSTVSAFSPTQPGAREIKSKYGGLPNAVFHGDEGGRPDIETTALGNNEYVAAFFPSAVTRFYPDKPSDPDGRDRTPQLPMIIGDTHTFAVVSDGLRRRCLITLHYVWLYDLLRCRTTEPLVWTLLTNLLWPATNIAPKATMERMFAGLESRLAPIVPMKGKLDVVEMLNWMLKVYQETEMPSS